MNNIPPVMNRKPAVSRTGLLCTALLAATVISAHAQNTGFGTVTPASKVTVKGNFAVGAPNPAGSPSSPYITTAAPVGGAIIEGLTGVGVVFPTHQFHVFAAADPVRFEGLLFTTPAESAQSSLMVVLPNGVVKKADWHLDTLTLTSTGTPPSGYTVTFNENKWRKIGSDTQVRVRYVGIGAGQGNRGTGDYIFNLPAGVSFNLTRTPVYTGSEAKTASLTDPATLNTSGIPMDWGVLFNNEDRLMVVPYTATTYRIVSISASTSFAGFVGPSIASIHNMPYRYQFTIEQ